MNRRPDTHSLSHGHDTGQMTSKGTRGRKGDRRSGPSDEHDDGYEEGEKCHMCVCERGDEDIPTLEGQQVALS